MACTRRLNTADICKLLKEAYDAIKASGLENDSLTQPICTQLFVPDRYRRVRSLVHDGGLQLKETVVLMARTYHGVLSAMVNEDRSDYGCDWTASCGFLL